MESDARSSCAACGADAAAADPFLGATIDGKFLLRRSLAQGGMGRVYEGVHVPLGKTIAVKVLHRHLVRDGAMKDGFRNEARAASALTHPNTVAVLDYGVTGSGIPYLVTDFVQGTGLDEAIAQTGRLSPFRARAITLQICDVLGALHERQILHRDVKPANLRLIPLRDGHELVKVLDFGLAKILDPWAVLPAKSSTAGMLVGTPAYMAPEQVQGRPLDARTDLYAVTLVLYEMLTGVRPFDAPTPVESAALHLVFRPPPPAEFNPQLRLPPAIDPVIQRGLDPSPERRFASARELHDAVAQALPETGTAPLDWRPWQASRTDSGAALAWTQPAPEPPELLRPRGRAARSWVRTTAAAALVLGGAMLGWSFLQEREPSPDPDESAARALPAVVADRAAATARPAGTAGVVAATVGLPARAAPRVARGAPPPVHARPARVLVPEVSATGDGCPIPGAIAAPEARPDALLRRARTLSDEGLLHEALGVYLDVVLIDPANAEAYQKAGILCVELGRKDDARSYLETYLRLVPAALDATAMRTLIDSL
jgi:hypothetical protein